MKKKNLKRTVAGVTAGVLAISSTIVWLPSQTRKVFGAADVALTEANFPDTVFLEYLTSNYDKDGDDSLSEEEISKITSISVIGKDISSLSGIEYLTDLEQLWANSIDIKEVDLSHNTKLKYIAFSQCDNLTSLDVSKNTELQGIDIFWADAFQSLTGLENLSKLITMDIRESCV